MALFISITGLLNLDQVTVSVLLGLKQVQLMIEGHGTDYTNKFDFKTLMSLEPKLLKNNVVSLSVNRLIIEPILVSNFTERILFIKNHSKTQTLSYLWKPCFIDGLLRIELMSTRGMLKPKETHPVVLKIVSLNEPCSVRVLLTVEFVDDDQIKLRERSLARRKERRDSTVAEFVISDSLIIEPINNRADEDEIPEPQYFNIALPITVNIVGVLDRDNCISAEDQMKQKPWPGIHLDADKFVKEYFEKIKVKEAPIHPEETKPVEKASTDEPAINEEMTQRVMDQLVSDAVFSDYFVEILKLLVTEPSPVYSQIKISANKRDKQRERETKRFLTKPSLSEVLDINQQIVIEALQARFHMGMVAKDPPDNTF